MNHRNRILHLFSILIFLSCKSLGLSIKKTGFNHRIDNSHPILRDLEEENEEEKGLDKRGKSGDEIDIPSNAPSVMDVEMTDISSDGKGKGSKLTKKSRKSSTSSKGKLTVSTKSSKKGSKRDGTMAPSRITQSPTHADSVAVEVESKEIYYTLAAPRVPSSLEYEELAQATRIYLKDYMSDIFEPTLVDIDEFLTFMVGNLFQLGESTQCTFRSTGRFDPDSTVTPTSAQLMGYLDNAFAEPQAEVYLKLIQGLSDSNVFSTTTFISTDPNSISMTSKKKAKKDGKVIYAVAGSAFGLLMGALFALSARKKRHEPEVYAKNNLETLSNDLSTIEMNTQDNLSAEGDDTEENVPGPVERDLDGPSLEIGNSEDSKSSMEDMKVKEQGAEESHNPIFLEGKAPGNRMDSKPKESDKRKSVPGNKGNEDDSKTGEVHVRADGKKVRRVMKPSLSVQPGDKVEIITRPDGTKVRKIKRVKKKPVTESVERKSVPGNKGNEDDSKTGEVHVRADGKKVRRVMKPSLSVQPGDKVEIITRPDGTKVRKIKRAKKKPVIDESELQLQ